MFEKLYMIPIWLCLTLAGHAQKWDVKEDFQTKFTHLNTSNGLSNNQVLDILQGSNGLMWIATEDGLNRYDGYEFLVFRNIPTDTSSISSNLITSLAEDIYGNLWVGTTFGLNKYDSKLDSFIHYFFNPKDKNSLRDNHIRALLADNKGILWIETLDGYLHSLDIKTGEIKYYRHQKVYQEYYHYHDILKLNDSILWLGGRSMNVHSFNINTGEFKVYYSARNKKQSKKRVNDVSSYYLDSRKKLWVTGLDGAYILDPETGQFNKHMSGSTFSIFEEKDSVFWFGTGNGLYIQHLDSQQMTHITAQSNNPFSLSSNHINKIIKDKSGVVWIATNNGLDLYSYKKNHFKHFYHVPGENQTISGNNITALVQDQNDNLWIGTASNGLNKMDLKSGEIEHFRHSKTKNSLISDKISSLYFDSNHNLWIGIWAGLGFNKLNIKTSHFSSFVIDPESTNIDWYQGFLQTNNKEIYLSVWGGYGIYSIPFGTKTIDTVGKYLSLIPNDIFVNNICLQKDSLIWLGGKHGQINAYNRYSKTQLHFKSLNLAGNSFKEIQQAQNYHYNDSKLPDFDSIRQTIYFNDGIYFASNKGLLEYHTTTKEIVSSDILTSQPILAMYANHTSLAVLTQNALWRLNKRSNTWDYISLNKILPQDASIHLLIDSSSIWIASGKELFLLKETGLLHQEEKFEHDIAQLSLWSDHELILSTGNQFIIKKRNSETLNYQVKEKIIAFLVNDGQLLWLGKHMLFETRIHKNKPLQTKAFIDKMYTQVNLNKLQFTHLENDKNYLFLGSTKGLFYYHKINKTLYYLREREQNFMGMPIHLTTCITEHNANDIWLGTTSSGISRWHPKSNEIINYTSNEFDSAAYWGYQVNFIYKDSRGLLWSGGEGLNLYHPENDSFSHYTMQNGLASNKVLGMEEDKDGKLWIATDNGLSCFSLPEQNFTNYHESSGLPDNELTGACCKLNDGRMAFGTKHGLFLFEPDNLEINQYIPPVIITEVQINDNQILRDLSNIDSLSLNPQNNHLSFQFTSLDYNSPMQNNYRYKLEGVDQDWIETDAKNRKINYSNLHSGTYIFHLQGSNNSDVWNRKGAELCIIILPHFYEKWWFYLSIILLIAFTIWMIIRYRVREIKLQHKAAELEQKVLRAQMNPHFIFNSLGAIQSFIFKNEPIEAATYLSNFSELVRLILDNSRKELIPLTIEIKTLDHYLDLQKLRFGEKFKYQINVDEDLNKEMVSIPPMLAQPFIENSIEHGFAGMKEKGTIRIAFKLLPNQIQLICEDNGIGIEASLKNKKDQTKPHQSLATKITRERIKVLNKTYTNKIELEIQDLKNIDQYKTGTRVTFTIPLIINIKNPKP